MGLFTKTKPPPPFPFISFSESRSSRKLPHNYYIIFQRKNIYSIKFFILFWYTKDIGIYSVPYLKQQTKLVNKSGLL